MQLELKTCPCCKEAKGVSLFPKDAKRKDGLHPYCKSCVNAKSKAYYEDNLEKARAKRKAYDAEHKIDKQARTREWRKNNPERHAATRKKQREARKDELNAKKRRSYAENPEYWRAIGRRCHANNAEKNRARSRKHAKDNPEQYAVRAAKYRARKLKATPIWGSELTTLVIAEAFNVAKRREVITGFKWHVDHVVPLKGKLVSGLHVWNNIQVIPAIENQRKYNRA